MLRTKHIVFYCMTSVVADIFNTIFGLYPEPNPVRDKEILIPDPRNSIDNVYEQIRFVYDQAAAESKLKRKMEMDTSSIDPKELREIIERTSVKSLLLKNRIQNFKTNNNENQVHETNESLIDIDFDTEEIPKEFKEQSKYKNHYITSSDTLEGIALQYSVRVSELRRINNIRNFQDFYAKDTILVPENCNVSFLSVFILSNNNFFFR